MLKGRTLKPLFLFISSDSRRKRTKEDCYPQGPLHRGMQHEKSQGPTIFLRFGIAGHAIEFLSGCAMKGRNGGRKRH